MDPQSWLNFGIAGAMLWWFTRRLETWLEKVDDREAEETASTNRLTRMIGLNMLQMNLAPPIRAQINDLLAETDAAEEYNHEKEKERHGS